MADTFCILPWNHLEVKPTGTVKICCVASREIQIEGRPALFGEMTLEQIWNSQYMQTVRRKMLNGEALPECAHCYRHEVSDPQSLRWWTNREWGIQYQTSNEGLKEMAQIQGEVVDKAPAYLQLSLGNECNLKCRMCCSDYSSQINDDPVHSLWAPHSNTVTPEHSNNWYKDNNVIGQLFSQPQTIRKLYVTGGEPMLSKQFEMILELLIQHGNPKQIDIHINTNGTVFNGRTLEQLVQFRGVLLGCSIDGYGDDFEYIRYPGKWGTVRKMLQRFRDYNLYVGINPTVQAYNALNISELFRFCDEENIICSPQIMYGPEHLTIPVMPKSAREIAASRLDAYIDSPAANDRHIESRQRAVPVRNYLRQVVEPSNITRLREDFMMFTNDLDLSRSQDFKTTHAELYEKFESSGFKWIESTKFFRS